MAVGFTDSTNCLKSKTSDLKNWIRKVKTKKVVCKRRRNADLYIDAVLRHALKMAEHELHAKQQLRKQRWQQMRATVTTPAFPSTTIPRTDDASTDAKEGRSRFNESQCDAICSLDDFLGQLKLVKCHARG